MLWKIYLYENVLFILHYKYPNNLYSIYRKFHEMNRFVKLIAVSKLSTFFIHPVYTTCFLHTLNFFDKIFPNFNI